MKWLNRILATVGGSRRDGRIAPGEVEGLLDYVAFSRELLRQRALADRSGGGFVLLVFETGGQSGGAGAAVPAVVMGNVLMARLRLSDIAGIYDESGTRLGVILSDTNDAGATRFISSVEELLRMRTNGKWREDARSVCAISRYPMDVKFSDVAASEVRPAAAIPSIPRGIHTANVSRP